MNQHIAHSNKADAIHREVGEATIGLIDGTVGAVQSYVRQLIVWQSGWISGEVSRNRELASDDNLAVTLDYGAANRPGPGSGET